MTDSEIIKALECCVKAKTLGDCLELKCPLSARNGCSFANLDSYEEEVTDRLIELALGLIHRQQAEIERLTDLNKALEADIFNEKMNYENLAQHIFEIREWEAEVKFRKKKIQAEAITEFAERLKQWCSDSGRCCEYIDNLVKEMVGDGNESTR